MSKSPPKKTKGIRIYSNGKYFGNFLDNIREGEGTFFYDSGDKYIGSWHNGLPSGEGKYYYKSGSYYKGFWKMEI